MNAKKIQMKIGIHFLALIKFFRHNELVVICNNLIICLLRPINNVDNLDDDDANVCSLT